MNVTLKLPDDLVREARHLALDENASLSSLVGELLKARLQKEKGRSKKAPNLSESLMLPEEPEWFGKTGFPLPTRDAGPARGTPFHLERDLEE